MSHYRSNRRQLISSTFMIFGLACCSSFLATSCSQSDSSDKGTAKGGTGGSGGTNSAGTNASFGGSTDAGSGGSTDASSGGSSGGTTGVGGASSGGSTAGGSSAGGKSAVDGAAVYAGQAGTLVTITPTWDWNGIVGTGQSLAVGTQPIVSKTQPYNNLKLDLGGATVPPWDSTISSLAMAPLVEPIRSLQVTYPSPYPLNLYGETPHSAMANQITAMVRYNSTSDYASVHTVVGESGQGMVAIKKQTGETTGTTGRAYAATLFEAEAITRLAKAAGKTYGIGAIVMTHGETDSGSSTYKDELIQLLADYNTDLAAITGQTKKIPMLLSQHFAYPNSAGQRPMATLTQWQLGVERPTEFVCVGPKYQYPGATKNDGVHLSSDGYRQYGEKVAQVYYERIVLGHDWTPLQPLSATRDGRKVTVTFHVPVPPLTWDESFSDPTQWPKGKGFELRAINTIVPIESVEISGNTVIVTAGKDLPTANLSVGYALTANSAQLTTASRAFRWGKLRDSDPFIGYSTGVTLPNYSVAFDMPVP